MTYAPSNTEAPFLPVTFDYPKNPQELQERFPKVYRDISSRLNLRQIGSYPLKEIIAGQQFFTSGDPQNFRGVYRLVIEIGAIAAGATFTAAHGITGFSTLTFTHIYGTAITAAGTFNKVPLPYVSATLITNQIQIDADDTNYRIIVGATASNVISGILILEYVKS